MATEFMSAEQIENAFVGQGYAYVFFISLAISTALVVFHTTMREHSMRTLSTLRFFATSLLIALVGSKITAAIGFYLSTSYWSLGPSSISGFLVFLLIYFFYWIRQGSKPNERKAKLEVAKKMAWALPLAQGIGRFGCFYSQCCQGRGPLAWPLLEAAFCLALAFFIYRFLKKTSPYKTLQFYIIAYGLGRFLLDFLRIDLIRGHWGILSIPQWTILALFLWLFLDLRLKGDFNKPHEM